MVAMPGDPFVTIGMIIAPTRRRDSPDFRTPWGIRG